MLRRFSVISNDLIQVSEGEHADIPVNAIELFKLKVRRYELMMKEAYHATVELQRNMMTLSNCLDILDSLQDIVEDGRSNPDSILHRCKLGSRYIAHDSFIVHSRNFQNAVCKIHRNQVNLLTDPEKEAVRHLREDTTELPFQNFSNANSFKERIAKKRKIANNRTEYITCDFVHGSVAEVERLWSLCGRILSDNCKRLTPQLFEALVFLRINK